LQHLRSRRLLLERLAQVIRALAQLVEQAGVLDCDDGLGGEMRQQLDLFIAERSNLLAVDNDSTNQLFFLEHWHRKKRPRAGNFDDRYKRWLAFNVGVLVSEIGDVLHLLRTGDPGEGILGTGVHDRFAPQPKLCPCRRRTVHRGNPKLASVIKQEVAEVRLADVRRIGQYGLEHRLQLARRA
jgi:hypothetical protein